MVDYDASSTCSLFHHSDSPVRGLIGPIGCLSGDALVITDKGLVRIDALNSPTRVLSWDESLDRFRFVLASVAFPKGRDYLYRVRVRHGEWLSAGHHLVLCEDGEYRQVQQLTPGQSLHQCSYVQKQTSYAYLLQLLEGVRRWWQTDEGLMDRCGWLSRLCGRPLHQVPIYDITSVPSHGDAPIAAEVSSEGVHIRRDQPYALPSTMDCLIQKAGQPDAQGCEPSRSFVRTVKNSLTRLRYALNVNVKGLKSGLLMSKACSVVNRNIISIDRMKEKEDYWDIQVPDTNNYVTVDGTVHHNSGKSVACCVELFRRITEQQPDDDGIRRSRWVIIRNTYRELADTTLKTWHDWFPEELGHWSAADMTQHIELPGIKAEILFRALDRPQDVKKLLSLELTGGFVNEAREIPLSVIKMLRGRLGRYPSKRSGGQGWFGLIMDTNPPDTDHWWYRIFEEDRPDGWQLFRQPGGLADDAENVENLPVKYYETMMQGADQQWIDVYVHGKYGFVMDGKPVYPEYQDDVHASDDVIPYEPSEDLWIGLDFGLTPAATFAQEVNGQWRFIDEIVCDDVSAEELAPMLSERINRHYKQSTVYIYGDPSGDIRAQSDKTTPFKMLEAAGVNAEPTDNNDPVIRHAALSYPMRRLNMHGAPALQISPKCKMLRKGLAGGYKYKRIQVSGDERFQDKPDKNIYSHVVESAEYLMQGAGLGETVVGDTVTDWSNFDTNHNDRAAI